MKYASTIIAIIIITLTMPILFFINLAWHRNKNTNGKVINNGWRANAVANCPWKNATTALVIPHNGQGILKILKSGQGTNTTKSAKQPINNKCISNVFMTFFLITHHSKIIILSKVNAKHPKGILQ